METFSLSQHQLQELRETARVCAAKQLHIVQLDPGRTTLLRTELPCFLSRSTWKSDRTCLRCRGAFNCPTGRIKNLNPRSDSRLEIQHKLLLLIGNAIHHLL